jgi:hypothetical protein
LSGGIQPQPLGAGNSKSHLLDGIALQCVSSRFGGIASGKMTFLLLRKLLDKRGTSQEEQEIGLYNIEYILIPFDHRCGLNELS